MRNYINLFENAQSDNQVGARLLKIATTLSHLPFDIEWDLSLGNVLKVDLKKAKRQYEESMEEEADNSGAPFEAQDYIEDFLPSIYRAASHDFGTVRSEIEKMTLDYQGRKGSAMDDEAGHTSAMHFVESSDWLSAMKAQGDAARQLANITVSKLQDIAEVANVLDGFIEKWSELRMTDQGEEASLTEGMTTGLAETIPLLMYATKVLG